MTPGWRLVVSAILHPCADGVVGDLHQHIETGVYRLRTADSLMSVPQGCAQTVDAHEQAVEALTQAFLRGEALTLPPIDPRVGYDAARRLLVRLTAPERTDP